MAKNRGETPVAALFDDDDEHVRDERASDGEKRASGAVR